MPTGMIMPRTIFVDEPVLWVDFGALLLGVVVDATLVSRALFSEGPVSGEPVNEVRVLILEACVMGMLVDRTVDCALVVDWSLLRMASGRSSVLRLIHEGTPVLSRVNGAPIVITIVEKVDRVSQVSFLFE